MTLLRLLLDFDADHGIRNAFNRAPQEVLDRYGVSLAEYQAFRALPQGVRTLLPAAILEIWQRLQDPSADRILWPGPQLRCAHIEPAAAKVGERTNFSLTIAVCPPQGTPEDEFTVYVTFRERSSNAVVDADVQPVQLPRAPIGLLSVACSATFGAPGEYIAQVRVKKNIESAPSHETDYAADDFDIVRVHA